MDGTFWCTSMTRLCGFGFTSFSLRTPLFYIGEFGWGDTEEDPRLKVSKRVHWQDSNIQVYKRRQLDELECSWSEHQSGMQLLCQYIIDGHE